MDKPKIRALEVFPVKGEEGKMMVIVSDPEGLSRDIYQFPGALLILLGFMDGEHTIQDIQTEVMRTFGILLYSDMIEEIVKKMDEFHLLENENYFNWRRQIVENFLASPTRVPHHSGYAYPADSTELKGMLDEIYKEERLPKEEYSRQPLGVIAPHIDIGRGGFSFASAYRTLRMVKPPATFFIFGTCHLGMDEPFAITKKHFETPLGTFKNATEIVEALVKRLPWLTANEFSHRREHSIEFQAIFLKHLFNESDIKIVPILCNSFHPFFLEGKNPKDDSKICDSLGAFSEAIKSAENPVLIAGADFSHIGPRFGDRVSINEEVMGWIRQEDLNMLKLITDGDADGFFNLIAEEKDRRKICGLPPVWSLLKLLPPKSRGVLLSYQQSYEPQTGSVVSFGSVSFHPVEDIKYVDADRGGKEEQND
ncbi:MAG: AmmeMemoRadiSam system protein B [Planctomycetota bacterium]|nr:AmmeMemoRadiSam system protein B [Planctomycetota bacterium]